jgi:oligopeptide/dipeptide ABC transporter ATP-binding protein
MTPPLLRAEGIHRGFRLPGWGRGRALRALRGVDLEIGPGETLALVGESGSGKSTLGRILVALDRPDAGRVLFEGQDLFAIPARHLRAMRPRFQMIFQDPGASLDPRMRVGAQIREALGCLARNDDMDLPARVVSLLEKVGLPAAHAARYPHQLSGGQRQRVAIARALATEPLLLVCDEPVSALDVLVQARILTLLRALRDEAGLACLFITHDLRVARAMGHRLAVLHAGRIVEIGLVEQVFGDPRHPFTRELMLSMPGQPADSDTCVGEAAAPAAEGACPYGPRCPRIGAVCAREAPLLEVGGGHRVACWKAAPQDRGSAQSWLQLADDPRLQ